MAQLIEFSVVVVVVVDVDVDVDVDVFVVVVVVVVVVVDVFVVESLSVVVYCVYNTLYMLSLVQLCPERTENECTMLYNGHYQTTFRRMVQD